MNILATTRPDNNYNDMNSSNLRVALVHDWLNGMRGGEKVLEGLSELYPEAPIFTLFCEPEKISSRLRSHEIHTSIIQRIPGWQKYYRNFLPIFPWAIEQFNLNEFDLIISISHCVAKSVKRPEGSIHICYCNSPMRYIWDLYDDYFGHLSSWNPKRMAVDYFRPFLQRWDKNSSERVDHFIANSKNIARKIKTFYDRDAMVIYPPVDTELFRPDDDVENREEFYLVVSALVAYKKIDLAVRAFEDRSDKLIIVGIGPELSRLQKIASSNVELIGWQSPEQLKVLYQRCRALIFPGVEDFGIVPVEAMACGAPVIAYKKGGLSETVIDGVTGLLFADQSANGLNDALNRFHGMKFNRDVLYSRAQEFSRLRFMQELKEFIELKSSVLR